MVIKSIDRAIEVGFEPSWNKDTNQQQSTPEAKSDAPEGTVDSGTVVCPIHGVKMFGRDGKFGKYWSHGEKLEDDSWRNCNGKGWK